MPPSDKLKGKGSQQPRDEDTNHFLSKLSDEVTTKICDAIRIGVSLDGAAQYGGITRDTFYRWIRLGRMPDADPRLLAFAEAVDAATAEWEFNSVTAIHQDESWQSKAWQLERRKPDEYGRKLRIEQDGSFDSRAPLLAREFARQNLDMSLLTDDELHTLLGLMQKMRGNAEPLPAPDGPLALGAAL